MGKVVGRIAILHYSHRHGDDVIPVVMGRFKFPKITNELLHKLGVDDPELERDDESAEWMGPFVVKELPEKLGPREWSPHKDFDLAILIGWSISVGVAIAPVRIASGMSPPDLTDEMVDLLMDDPKAEAEWRGPFRFGDLPKLDEVSKAPNAR
jgi:hypothetical protein